MSQLTILNEVDFFQLRFGVAFYTILTRQSLWRQQVASILRYADPHRLGWRQVLDVGCGPGDGTLSLAAALGPQAEVLGVDRSPGMIARAERLARQQADGARNVRFAVADATALELPDASCDLAVIHSLLYLVDDRLAVLREAHRVLSPRGMLLLMEPNAEGSLLRALGHGRQQLSRFLRLPWATARFAGSMLCWRLFSRAVGRFTSADLHRLMTEAGFKDVRTYPTLGGLGLHGVGHVD